MWEENENKLKRTFLFANFKLALSFILQVGETAEDQHHHPEIYNSYNKVSLSLTTHDAGNCITDKDRKFAKSIDQIFKQYE